MDRVNEAQRSANVLRPKGMFIGDEEIVEKYGAEVLPMLDEDPKTQKGKATWPAEARSRVEVEKKIAEVQKRRNEHRSKAS